MNDIRFTKDHEWLRIETDGRIAVGITEYAQEQLGDIVYVELPQVGQIIAPGAEAVVIESVKAAGDIKMPVGGTVVEINGRLADAPELVNRDPLGEGWLFRIDPQDTVGITGLMDAEAYKDYIAGL